MKRNISIARYNVNEVEFMPNEDYWFALDNLAADNLANLNISCRYVVFDSTTTHNLRHTIQLLTSSIYRYVMSYDEFMFFSTRSVIPLIRGKTINEKEETEVW